MKNDLKILIHILLTIVLLKVFLVISGIFNKYYDFLIPLIPFFVLIKNTNILIVGYLIVGVFSSIIHYDEMFSIMLGYGISLILLLNFSRKYSLTNLFNYVLSVFAISLIVFIIQMLLYFAKDKIVVIRDMYQFLFSNIVISLFYYYLYKIIIFLRNIESVKR